MDTQNKYHLPVPEPEKDQQQTNDGFNDGSPVIRPWLLVLMVFTMMAGLGASAVINVSESVASSKSSTSCQACPFARAAQQLKANVKSGTACPMKAEQVVPAADQADAVAAYEAQLKLSEPVQPDLSAGNQPMALAAQADDSQTDTSAEKTDADGKAKDDGEKQSCGAKSSCDSKTAKSGCDKSQDKQNKSCPAASKS